MQGGVIGGICLLAFLLSKGRAEETNGFNEYKFETPSDLKSGTSFSQAEARTNVDIGNLYNQGAKSHPYSPSYPYSSGVNSLQPSAEAGNGLQGQLALKSSPYFNDEQGKHSVSTYDLPTNLPSRLSPTYQYNPETKTIGSEKLFQSNIEPYQPLPIPNVPYNYLVPYKDSSSSQKQNDNEAYEPVPLIKPKDNYYTVPYHEGQNPELNIISHRSHIFKSDLDQEKVQNNPYQEISMLKSNRASFEPMFVPYKEPTPSQPRQNYPYLPLAIPNSSKQQDSNFKPYSEGHSKGFERNTLLSKSSGESESYRSVVIPESEHETYNDGLSFSQKQTANEVYRPILRMDSREDAVEVSQSISRSDLDSAPYRHASNANIKVHVHNDADNFTSASRSSYPYETPKDHGYDPATDYDLMSDLKSKSDWTPNEYDPPRIPTPKLYPLGANKQEHADLRPAAGGAINQYSLGPYDYPSESPFRPGFNMATYEGPPYMFLNAKSRMIQPHEYIFPNKMPGYENVIQCTKENEFHHFWSEGVDCMTCICFNEYGILTPVCASCGGCRKPYTEPIPELPVPIPVQPATPKPTPIIPEPYFTPVKPEPIPEKPIPEPNLEVPTPQPYPKYPTTPGPSQITELIPTLPPQPAQATCNPLPSGQPFTNPLHPCQICICTESDMSGKGDVQIECKENPQCISPVDVNTLPPLPDAPMPIPLPICEKFPEHVLFPHPTDTCRLCKCSKRDAESGLPEQLITCYPHPDCTVKTEPVTEPVPSLPIPLDPYKEKPNPEPGPIPSEPMKGLLEPIIEPVPLPEIVTVEPLPWPPITTVSPGPPLPALTPPPGPLPGPSPHESCRPYPPNQTFQHPWDECQICLCTEATAVGMITVEVNCYTKPSCCIEPPDSVKSAISGYTRQYPVISNPLLLPAPDAVVTSTFRPPSIYPSYTPRPANVYPGTNQVAGADSVKQGYSPQTYPVLQTDTGYVDPSSNYLYPRNYQPPFVNQQYPEYPPRMPLRPGSFKLDDFGYQQNYQYAPGDAMENNYPGPRGHFQSYDPRFPPVNAPSAYPAMYQRTSYDKPPAYPPTPSRDVYGKPNQKQIGANVQNVQSNYLGSPARSKSGKDEDETDYS